MSKLSGTSFGNLYGTSGTTFPDNTTGEISEGDMRTFGKDIQDSFLNITDHLLDEDDMASNSATKVPSQQSVKAYVNIRDAVTASGTNTYTATITPAPAAYVSGKIYAIKFTNANTGAATINLNSLGAKSIKKNGSTDLGSGDISAGQIYLLAYDGTNFQVTSSIGGGGTTLAAGVYTPTLTGVSNIGAVVVQGVDWPYMRVGSVVTVSGQINIDPTASATTTTVRISLPIASNFTNDNSGCAGTMVETGGASNVGAIRPDSTNNEALIIFVPTATNAKSYSLMFTYSII